jgi:hypothetical protein
MTPHHTTGEFDLILAAQILPGVNAADASNANYFASLGAGCDEAWAKETWGCQNGGAATCRLDPCVRTYKATVEQGKLQEQTVAQYTNMYISEIIEDVGPYVAMADATCVKDPAVRQRLRELGVNITDTSTMIPYPVGISTESSNQLLPSLVPLALPPKNVNGSDLDLIPHECIYDIEYPSIESMTTYLSSYLSGSVSTSANGYSFLGAPQQIAIFNASFVNTKSINDTFQSIAEGISLRMRVHGYPGFEQFSKAVKGTVLRTETCVGVRWLFIIEPAVVVGFTLIFFVAMIGKTEGKSSAVAYGWKSSPLPLVLGAFEGLEDRASGQTSVTELERMAGSNVRLRRGQSSVNGEG